MNLDEFRAYIEAQREAQAEAARQVILAVAKASGVSK